jgi:transcriptional regulator with XRE-family HTH domain
VSFFHQNIKTLRRAWKLSQNAAGDIFGISQSAYQKWEDDTEPNYDTLIKVANFFKVSLDTLLLKEMDTSEVPKRYANYQSPPETSDGNKLEEPGIPADHKRELVTMVDVTQMIQEMEELKERVGRLEK